MSSIITIITTTIIIIIIIFMSVLSLGTWDESSFQLQLGKLSDYCKSC